jgi:ubiquinone/menaquinone biosynthesis C-methylase UbiE
MNPWLKIPLEDYEAHMAMPSVGQAKMLSDAFAWALETHAPSSVAVLGCAGGNGFDRLPDDSGMRIIGIDINPDYIKHARCRYKSRLPGLEFVVADIERSRFRFAPVDLIFAGLVFEYVDLGSTLRNIRPMLNTGGSLVAVLQLPSSNMNPITPSPNKSLGLLDVHMRLVPEDYFTSCALETEFVVTSTRKVQTTGGKRFFIGDYSAKNAEQKNEPDS